MSNRADFDETGPPGMRIFLCGDVMLGRGIDQALPYPCAPDLHEEAMRSAAAYLQLAERANGPIPWPLNFAEVWGAAMEEWSRVQPHARILNLETSITRSDAYDPKGINYRMRPEVRGLLVRIPLGPRPWLHQLRGRSPGFVRRLRRYYAGSDFSGSCISGYGSSPSRCGPCDPNGAYGRSRDLPVPAQGASVHARVSDHAGSDGRSQ